jgi:hypothetical protein
VLTGFNTDVEYEGVVYHVQTEDKGLRTPFILSLVYTGGEILASKRAPYDDLIAQGFDEGVLAQRLSRQHKLICAAVHAGRIEDLKRLGDRDAAEKASAREKATADKGEQKAHSLPVPGVGPEVSDPTANNDEVLAARPDPAAEEESDPEEPLKMILLDDEELIGGEWVTLRVLVSKAAGDRREPVKQARVLVKVLGSTFRPQSIPATTNDEGVAVAFVLLPEFETGRAAILVQANVDGHAVEIRRIVLPAQSS